MKVKANLYNLVYEYYWLNLLRKQKAVFITFSKVLKNTRLLLLLMIFIILLALMDNNILIRAVIKWLYWNDFQSTASNQKVKEAKEPVDSTRIKCK